LRREQLAAGPAGPRRLRGGAEGLSATLGTIRLCVRSPPPGRARMIAGQRLARLGAFTPEFADAEALHQGLARWNRRRLAVQTPSADWRAELNTDSRMLRLEGAFVEAFRAHVAPLVADVPSDS